MRIVLIKKWERKGKAISKGTEMEVTNDLGRELIKKKIAKEQRDGLLSLVKALVKKEKAPKIESKDGYREKGVKSEFNNKED